MVNHASATQSSRAGWRYREGNSSFSGPTPQSLGVCAAFICDQARSNWDSVTSATQFHCPKMYMPHHAVFRKDASTTKTRVVFNASAAKLGEKSLNGTLDQGPSILPTLVGLLLRFRLKKIALQADIKKALSQTPE